MTRKERLIKTLKGESVDRPPVSFYELNGLDEDINNKDPYNIYNDPSWKPLIELTKEKTDRIVIRSIIFNSFLPDVVSQFAEIEEYEKNDSLYTIKKIKIGNKILQSRTRRDKDVNTVWTEEHFIKDIDDLKAILMLPFEQFSTNPDFESVLKTEEALSDTGIVMIDTPDPICLAASLFSMDEYTIMALSEPELFHNLLERFAFILYNYTNHIAQRLPNRLWRIYGPEYASEPFLPPRLFKEYVVKYDKLMIDMIHSTGGWARVHSHGNLRNILDLILEMGADAIDPIEPPPQGDVYLSYVREKYGKNFVLFGNLEITDIENLPPSEFSRKVYSAIEEGTRGDGRGFVLMPSSCPYGRFLSPMTLRNYEIICEIIEKM
ncbi:MAG TPA: uroporphyrinogen decarboxylase family protein [Bacteroidota bacterium]|nr:uroporphyrinogen decarboxylase family protein [Bacteroidota bacterium]